MSVAYRGRGDITIWADGRMDGAGRTPRLEWEWSALFPAQAVPSVSGWGVALAAGLMWLTVAAVQRLRR